MTQKLFQVEEGAKDIKVGALIALVVDADEDWKSVEMPDSASSSASAPSSASDASSAPVEAAEPPPGQFVKRIFTSAPEKYFLLI